VISGDYGGVWLVDIRFSRAGGGAVVLSVHSTMIATQVGVSAASLA